MPPEADFTDKITVVVATIPWGATLTYADVAERAGYGRGTGRSVGAAMDRAGEAGIRIPWWRVVGSDGRLRTPWNWGQRERLMEEGVLVQLSTVRYKPLSPQVVLWMNYPLPGHPPEVKED